MKKTTRLFLLSLIVGATFTGHAQTKEQRARIIKHTNVTKLLELSAKYSREYHEARAEAYRLAAINNWPLEKRENGGVSKLIGVSNEGTPLYLTTHNQGSALTSRTNHLQPGGSLGLNLTGQGMSVGLWDGDYPRPTHVDFAGRYTVQDGSAFPIEFHPTHVLGTIMGSGANNSACRGMAYQAFAYVNNFDDDFSEMAVQSTTGLLLSNHSYGLNVDNIPSWYLGAYITFSAQVDEITSYAPYYQPVFSAGNDGNGSYDRLTDRSLSKNGIAVGAVPETNYGGPSSVSIANFSSWGPSDDRRVKPDIVTKGVSVRSASNASNTAYGLSDGTSMATPGITGSLLLVQQYYGMMNDGNYMRSATLRGLMAHCADEAGAANGPDPVYGWGLMNTKRMAETIMHKGAASVIDERILMPGQTVTMQVVALGSEPLIATLAWTDPAGNTNNGINNLSTPVLVNDLDIRVVKDNQTTYPWKLGSSNASAAVKGDNIVDNIEKVELANATGTYTITISHKGNTLINPGTILDEEEGIDPVPSQAYSLIITGIDATALSVAAPSVTDFTVWPNPAKDVLNIDFHDSPFDASAEVYDIQGRLVKKAVLSGTQNTVPVTGLSEGVYIVKVSNAGKSEVKKVFIQ